VKSSNSISRSSRSSRSSRGNSTALGVGPPDAVSGQFEFIPLSLLWAVILTGVAMTRKFPGAFPRFFASEVSRAFLVISAVVCSSGAVQVEQPAVFVNKGLPFPLR